MKKTVEEKIGQLAATYAEQLRQKINQRVEEMQADDRSHFLIYRVLGITDEEGQLIDIYQNKGRFLYRYAGTFLEEAAKLCLQEKYPTAGPAKIANTQGRRPATFEIDYLIGQEAFEIKWRDATTDGDHITKEHTRIKVIAEAGYTPIRIMFFYPNREQAIRIQQTLETLYAGVQGRYYYGDRAWEYIKECTGIDLRAILEKLAAESAPKL
ncbi:MAG TPA: ApaLI family restriction endonuclease [Anaerolineae bacterium]|nr:ApaLI family restriction endonuclease [Anaerolineae bacterium]